MPREKPRTADEIDTELDEWLTQRTELQANLSGLTELIASLQSLIPKDGRYPPPAELTTELSELRRLSTEGRAQLAEANQKIETLTERLASLSADPPKPAAKPGDGPSPPPPSDPPKPRQTRTGVTFL